LNAGYRIAKLVGIFTFWELRLRNPLSSCKIREYVVVWQSPELAETQKLEPTWRAKMKLSGNQFNYSSARLIAAVTLLATLAFAPGVVLAADKDAHMDRAELHIKDMHAKLKITAAQEPQWAKVAQAMRDDATTMDALTKARSDHANDMTAVDDLKSYGDIVDAHADGIKKLTPAFADLYASMSDPQKKAADTLFRRGEHAAGHKISKAK
jgi:periplasmic protein CpxP/Spy